MRSKGKNGGRHPGAVVLPLGALLASVAACGVAARLDATLEQVGREDRVIARASAVSRLLHELEKTGQAPASASATPGPRAPYRKAEERLAACFDDLERLVSDDPEQSRLLALIRKQAGRWASRPGEDAGGPGPGRELLNGVRIFLASFLDAEGARRDRLGAEARTLAGSVLPALAGGTALLAALGFLAALRLRRRLAAFDDAAEYQERERLGLLMEAMKYYAIFSLDTEGRITSWSTEAERILGYRPDDILSRNFSVFHDAEDIRRDMPQKNLTWAVQEGRAEEVRFISRKDGFRFLARVAIIAVRDPAGSLRGFTSVIHEVEEAEA